MVSPLYPFVGRYLDVGGCRMHYVEEGGGPPVVLLHGNPTWSFFYRDLIPVLAKSHRVVAPDHVGCGLSDKPAADRYPYNLERRVEDVGKLIDAVAPGQRVSLVVHDWGGMIGCAWAVRNPDRIERLVVMNTAAFPLPAGKRLPRSLWLGRNRLLGPPLVRGFNAFCRGAARWCVVRKPLDPAVRDMYMAPYDSWSNRVAVHRFVRTIPLQPGESGFDIVAATDAGLPKLAHKPLFIGWGLRDFVFDADFLAGWRSRFPRAEVFALEDAGHYLLEDAGGEVIPRIAEFLAR
jgi:haloalkane dehalogenase